MNNVITPENQTAIDGLATDALWNLLDMFFSVVTYTVNFIGTNLWTFVLIVILSAIAGWGYKAIASRAATRRVRG